MLNNEVPLTFISLFADANPLKAIKRLARSKSTILNALDSSGQTLLHAAAQVGNVTVVRWLIKKRVNINAMDEQGITPFHLAVRNDSAYLAVDCLLENGAQQLPDAESKTPFHKVIDSNIARLLHAHQGDFNAVDHQGHTPFYYALGKGIYLIDFFLSIIGADLVHEQEQDWLSLLKQNGDDEKKQQLIFLAACRQGYKEIVKSLLELYPNLINSRDSNGHTPYLYAAIGGKITLAEWLLKKGYSKPDEKDEEGSTALLLAATEGQIPFIKWLFKKDYAKPDEKNKFGETAFVIAARNEKIEVGKFLLENNYASVEGEDNEESTAVDITSTYGFVFMLVEYCCQKKNLNSLTLIIDEFLKNGNGAVSQDGLIKTFITCINKSCTALDFSFALQIAKIGIKLSANQLGEEAKKVIELAFQDLVDKVRQANDNSIQLTSIELLIEEFKSFDKPRALLVEANLCIERDKLEEAFDTFNTILALPGIENSIKESASLEIADLILNGYISVGEESGIDMDDNIEIKPEDDEVVRAKKMKLKQFLLITRAIQAYKYVAPFEHTEAGIRFLFRVHNMLMGIDSVEEVPWSADAISQAMARIDAVEPKVKQLLSRSFWDKVFATHKNILDKSNSSQESKQAASLTIAELFMDSRIGWNEPSQEMRVAFQAEDDEVVCFEKLQLARHPLITRAIQAYEYVIPYKDTEAGVRLLRRLHTIFTSNESEKKWTPEVIEQFGQYYGTETKFSEYVWQKARLERLDNPAKRQKISPEESTDNSFSL